MANLLDTIRTNSQSLPEQGVTDESNKLQTLLRAKSGKAVTGAAPAVSNLGEQQADVQANEQIQNQVMPQAVMQNTQQAIQSEGIQQQEDQQKASIAQARGLDTVQNRIRTQQVLDDLGRNKESLDLQKDNASLEQVASSLRLQDKQYLDNLQREGNTRRLNNSLEFNEALTQSIFDDNQDLLEKNLAGQSILNANQRDFSKALAQMGANDAYSMFKTGQQTAQEQQMWQSIGALGTAGVGAYGNMSDAADKKEYYTTGAGANDNSYAATQARK